MRPSVPRSTALPSAAPPSAALSHHRCPLDVLGVRLDVPQVSHTVAEPFSSAWAYLSIRMFSDLICQPPKHAAHSWKQTPMHQPSEQKADHLWISTEKSHCCLKHDAHICRLVRAPRVGGLSSSCMDFGARIRMSSTRGAAVKMGSEGSLAALISSVGSTRPQCWGS